VHTRKCTDAYSHAYMRTRTLTQKREFTVIMNSISVRVLLVNRKNKVYTLVLRDSCPSIFANSSRMGRIQIMYSRLTGKDRSARGPKTLFDCSNTYYKRRDASMYTYDPQHQKRIPVPVRNNIIQYYMMLSLYSAYILYMPIIRAYMSCK
jgi:hypothetical protein